MVARFPKNKKRGVWQQIALSILLGIPVLALIAFLVISDYRIYLNRADIQAQISKLQQQADALKEQGATLQQGLDQANQDNYQEAKLRDQGYKKPGEEVWAVIGKPSRTKDTSATDTGNFWTDLWNKIKNIQP